MDDHFQPITAAVADWFGCSINMAVIKQSLLCSDRERRYLKRKSFIIISKFNTTIDNST